MLNISYYFLTILLYILYVARSKDVNSTYNKSSITEIDAISKANQFSPEKVKKSELTTHNAIKAWEVYFTASFVYKFNIIPRIDHGIMVDIKGVSTSFEYELQTVMNFIYYEAAKTVIFGTKIVEIKELNLLNRELNIHVI